MTSHQFAKSLLDLPDLEIVVPKVVEYSDDEENNTAAPVLSKTMGVDPDGEPVAAWIICYKD